MYYNYRQNSEILVELGYFTYSEGVLLEGNTIGMLAIKEKCGLKDYKGWFADRIF